MSVRWACTPADLTRKILAHYQVDQSRESPRRQRKGQELREGVLSGLGHDLV